ncbi:hypothetical protein JTB14_005400 [Gonioctena quinquepunctata]|nr:hypothetical protein JTB14_005400 [Gonioctena quinquepunctata]
MTGKIMYFAFGSNLSTARMHVFNPNAVRVGIGKLDDYQVDFVAYSKIWKGYAATIVPKKDAHVWGAIWEIKDEDLESLDKQEGVHANIYYPINVDVRTSDGEVVKCRCYRQVGSAEEVKLEDLPAERKPTPAYVDTMVKGAEESGIPVEYINLLKKIPHNGSDVKPDLKYTYQDVLTKKSLTS